MDPVTMTEMNVMRRGPLEGIAEAFSGATLERVELDDGRRLVLKHLPRGGDWMTRASGASDRIRRLWTSGLLHRMGNVVDHTVIDIVRIDDHDVVVMRGAAAELLPPRVPVPRSTSRRLLAGLARLHDVGRQEPLQPLCPIGARYGMFAPALHAADPGPGPHPSRDFILAGWETFADLVDADVVDAVFVVHRDPGVLGRPLARFPATVLHGDAKLENLGLGPSGVVAVDWGDLTGFGPREVDVAWYALKGAARIGGSPGDVFDDYEMAAGRPLEAEALDLVCIGSLAQMGFRFAAFSVLAESAGDRAVAAAQLSWWTERARLALDRVGLARGPEDGSG
jgi:hypothetical protein